MWIYFFFKSLEVIVFSDTLYYISLNGDFGQHSNQSKGRLNLLLKNVPECSELLLPHLQS